MVLREIVSFGDYDFVKNMSSKGLVYVMKHSLTCPVSARALFEFENFSSLKKDVPCFVLRIQNFRSISDRIAQDTGIVHESPQVIVFKDGEPIWNDSHFLITKSVLTDVFDNN